MATDKTQTGITDLMQQTQELFRMNGAAAPQVAQFWQMQENMLKQTETFARHWFEHRHEATESALKALREMNSTNGSDPTAAMRAISEWQRGSFERMNADLQEWMTLCTHATQQAAAAQGEAAQTGADQGKATKAKGKSQAGSSGAKSDHGTPV